MPPETRHRSSPPRCVPFDSNEEEEELARRLSGPVRWLSAGRWLALLSAAAVKLCTVFAALDRKLSCVLFTISLLPRLSRIFRTSSSDVALGGGESAMENKMRSLTSSVR